ncbi:13256_t:CDS:10, partial [Ambispora leptoticha]
IINEEEAKKEIQEFIDNSDFSLLIENVKEIENKDLSNFKEKKVYPMNIPYDIRESLERDLKKEIIEVICEEKNYVDNTIHELTAEENQVSILNLILKELVKRGKVVINDPKNRESKVMVDQIRVIDKKKLGEKAELREPNKKAVQTFLIHYYQTKDQNEYILSVATGKIIREKTINNFSLNKPNSLADKLTIRPPHIIDIKNFHTAKTTDKNSVKLFIFTVQSLTQAKGKTARKTSNYDELLGQSLREHLSRLDDLVILADEHHLYYGERFSEAIRELKPKILIGLTGTPHEKTPTKEIIFDIEEAEEIRTSLIVNCEFPPKNILQVDSSKITDDLAQGLQNIDNLQSPTRIIVAVATFIEQIIGRGLRLPFGSYTPKEALNNLEIIMHDNFKELLDVRKSLKSNFFGISDEVDRVSSGNDFPQNNPESPNFLSNPEEPITGFPLQTSGEREQDILNQNQTLIEPNKIKEKFTLKILRQKYLENCQEQLKKLTREIFKELYINQNEAHQEVIEKTFNYYRKLNCETVTENLAEEFIKKSKDENDIHWLVEIKDDNNPNPEIEEKKQAAKDKCHEGIPKGKEMQIEGTIICKECALIIEKESKEKVVARCWNCNCLISTGELVHEISRNDSKGWISRFSLNLENYEKMAQCDDCYLEWRNKVKKGEKWLKAKDIDPLISARNFLQKALREAKTELEIAGTIQAFERSFSNKAGLESLIPDAES